MHFGELWTNPGVSNPTISAPVKRAKLSITCDVARELAISVDPLVHRDFGLSYPVTYRLNIPRTNRSLKAYKRSGPYAKWTELPAKTPNDFFNGIEAVRFDRIAGVAYVSVAFDAASDEIHLEITGDSGEPVLIQFEGICRYYDDRKAAVVVTADDWADVTNPEFLKVVHLLRGYRLPLTAAVITGLCGEETWRTIQQELDSGYLEVASHSRSHPKSLPYADPLSEIIGSREDILTRLNLPSAFQNGSRQYVYAWVAPYGTMNAENAQLVGRAGYLVDRLTYRSSGKFTRWSPGLHKYLTDGKNVEMGLLYGGLSNRPALNKRFDLALEKGSIYHIMLHPHDLAATGEWSKPYFTGHLEHISNRTDVWYANFGLLYLYHFVQDPEVGEIWVENREGVRRLQRAG